MSTLPGRRVASLGVMPLASLLLLLLPAPPALAQDCNLNGVPDADEIAAGASEDCNDDLVPDECEEAVRAYRLERLAQPGEAEPRSAVEGDFDGDGDLDLATGDSLFGGGGTAGVLLNGGRGDLLPAARTRTESWVEVLAAGDLDGDGDLDLAIVDGGAHALLGGGDGTLSAPIELPVPQTPKTVEVGDLDGDGIDEIVYATKRTSEVYVLRHDPAGVFRIGSVFATCDTPRQLALADFDADGVVDIAAVCLKTDGVAIHLGAGGLEFGPGVLYPASSDISRDLIAGDFNGDGLPDLCTVSNDDVAILVNEGGGRFLAPHLVPIDRGGTVAASDLDQDGDLDVVLTRSTHSGAVVLLGAGDGTIERLVDLDLGFGATTAISGDFDGDDVPDIVVRSGSMILLKSGSEITAPSLELTSFQAFRPHWGVLEDFDGDGDLDLAAAIREGQGVQLYLNRGDGTFEVGQGIPGGDTNVFYGLDVNADGAMDIVLDEGRIFINQGNATFEQRRGSRLCRGAFGAADLDRDGYVDLINASAASFCSGPLNAHFGREDGEFDPVEVPLPAGRNPSDVALGDFDADGRVDLAAATTSAEVFVFLSRGDRSFEAAGVHDAAGDFLVAGDFDGDGDLDLAASSRTEGSITVLRNRGGGALERETPTRLRVAPYSITTVDMDQDGLVDLVSANESGGTIFLLLGTRSGGFREPIEIPAGLGLRWVGGGDVDGDGDIDLVTTDRGGSTISVLFNRERRPDDTHRELICTPADFHLMSISSTAGGAIERLTKYIVPARPDDAGLLPPLFQNARVFKLHLEFLREVFPARFGDLTAEDYERLTTRRATRDYFIGVLYRLRTADGPRYGFSVIAAYDVDRAELPTVGEVRSVHERLSAAFPLGPLVYFPADEGPREDAAGWVNPGFEVYLEDPALGVEYIAYTQGVGFGRVRRLDRDAFALANDAGGISFQDILVLERAPRDIEGVVSGVVTAEPQGDLSHLAIRTARRGTPNAFVKDALDAFAGFDGKLVRFEVREAEYTVREATSAEAEAWWAESRPRLSVAPAIDAEFDELSTLDQIAALDPLVRGAPGVPPPETRFGGKATGFARLQTILTGPWERYRAVGFAVPLRHYVEFMRSNRTTSFLSPGREVTYEEYLLELFEDPGFRSDSSRRFEALRRLREEIVESGAVSADLVRRVALRIATVFGTTTERVRFRSSSNVEDALEFNGAGLYESTSGCAADDLDAGDAGPSRCDASRRDERGIARALRAVWASLWNFRAYEERAFFSVPQDLVAMGVLVSRAFPDEQANGVAFTGNLQNPLDRRYVVTVQRGESSVVSPEPGEIPEKDLLVVEDGRVVDVIRSVASSLVPPGEHVLSDEQLGELGALLAHIDAGFPVELAGHNPLSVLLDVEFKFDRDGELIVKQVRPFLSGAPLPPTPTFALEIAPGLESCGAFTMFRGPREAYELKSVARFRGRIELPTSAASVPAELFEEVRVGPARALAEPLAPGRFRLRRIPGAETDTYRFDYEQRYALPDGAELLVALSNLRFAARGDEPVEAVRHLDEEFLASEPAFLGELSGTDGQASGLVHYASCAYERLPLWEIEVELADASRLRFLERFDPQLTVNATSPASLIEADLDLGGARRIVDDYWSLVYTAARHNLNVRYWIVLDPPLEVPGARKPVSIVEVSLPDEVFDGAAVSYLDERFELIGAPEVASVSARAEANPELVYRRGDVNADGSLTLTDAVAFLGHLFQGAAAPPCEKTLDATDDGTVNLTDAVAILQHLFGGVALPPPVESCGEDPTPDGLACESYEACAG